MKGVWVQYKTEEYEVTNPTGWIEHQLEIAETVLTDFIEEVIGDMRSKIVGAAEDAVLYGKGCGSTLEEEKQQLEYDYGVSLTLPPYQEIIKQAVEWALDEIEWELKHTWNK